MSFQRSELKTKYEEMLSTLIELGLARSEARVFIALASTKVAIVSDISKISKVSRPDTYRALASLVDLGLIEEVISAPSQYRSLSVSEALSILIERREKSSSSLYKRAAKFYDLFKNGKAELAPHAIDNQFVVIPAREAMNIKVDKLAAETQTEICVILTLNRLLPWLDKKNVREALVRGVRLKILSLKPMKNHQQFGHVIRA